MCDLDPSSSHCSLFTRLKDGGRAVSLTQYMTLELISLVCLIFWTEVVLMIAMNREFAVPCLAYFFAVGTGFTHFLATITWFSQTQANVLGNCEGGSLPRVCATRGPAMAIAACVVLVAAIVVFLVTYAKRCPVAPRTMDAGEQIQGNFSPAQLPEELREGQMVDVKL